MPNEKTRHQILAAITAYRLEKGHWPQTAFELTSFARGAGRELDLSPFHLLRFLQSGPNRLTLDWTLNAGADGLASSGWLFVEVRAQGRDQLGWGAEWAERGLVRLEPVGCSLVPGVRRAS